MTGKRLVGMIMKHVIAAAGLALSFATAAAEAAPIEQIECVYDGVAGDVHGEVTAAALLNGDMPAAIKQAMETTLTACLDIYSWSDADAENSTRYFLMQSIVDNSEKALPAGHIKIVQGYFADNEAEFVGKNHILDSDPDKIVTDLTARGIRADEKKQEEAAMYHYWLVVAKQLRGDFVAGTLRD